MGNTLYVFVTSRNPDSYLNPIAHCMLANLISRVVFIHVADMDESRLILGKPAEGYSASICRHVQSLLGLLSEGRYRNFEKGTEVDLAVSYSAVELSALCYLYARCLEQNISWDHLDIRYRDLPRHLRLLKRAGPALFDVTAVRKSYLGDLIALSLIRRIDSLFTFDLKCPPNHDEPWRMLIHELRNADPGQQKYEYVNVIGTPIFERCAGEVLVRAPVLWTSSAATVLLLAIAIVIYYFFGEHSVFVQFAFIGGSIASLASLLLSLVLRSG